MDTVGTFKQADNPTQRTAQEATARDELEEDPRNQAANQTVEQPRREIRRVTLVGKMLAVIVVDAFLAAVEAVLGAAVVVLFPALPVHGMLALGHDEVALLEVVLAVVALLQHHILAVLGCKFGVKLLDIFSLETLVTQQRDEELHDDVGQGNEDDAQQQSEQDARPFGLRQRELSRRNEGDRLQCRAEGVILHTLGVRLVDVDKERERLSVVGHLLSHRIIHAVVHGNAVDGTQQHALQRVDGIVGIETAFRGAVAHEFELVFHLFVKVATEVNAVDGL